MDFSLPPATQELGAATYAFAKGLDLTADWRKLWQACADHGMLGLTMPARYGGAGYDCQTAIHILHEFGRGCPDNGLALGLSAQLWSMQMPILSFGSEGQKNSLLPALIGGEILCAHGVTEAGSGSDAMGLQTSAIADGDAYILTGSKEWIGMAPACDLAFVFAKTNPDHGAWGISAFLIDADTVGLTRGSHKAKAGSDTLPFGTLTFKECRIDKSTRLGPEGGGQSIFIASLDWERRFILATHVGAMKRQLEDCIAYGRDRQVFGAPIDANQSVSNRLADMRLRYETSLLMLQKAAWASDNGENDPTLAALTKLHISESFLANSVDAARTFAAKSMMLGAYVNTDLPDAVGSIIYGGTSDIQRQIIAKMQRNS
ncbi:MAG: acyl-CoA dehydrogenase family protein [Rhodobacteraceae bacterium]|nr:acyl-CoA dehydrogenase family protein [Paracoccaceae bacterium]PHR62281.1 MAG: acyl-CoA dehydrogenase [Robiginitomaculum sp.]